MTPARRFVCHTPLVGIPFATFVPRLRRCWVKTKAIRQRGPGHSAQSAPAAADPTAPESGAAGAEPPWGQAVQLWRSRYRGQGRQGLPDSTADSVADRTKTRVRKGRTGGPTKHFFCFSRGRGDLHCEAEITDSSGVAADVLNRGSLSYTDFECFQDGATSYIRRNLCAASLLIGRNPSRRRRLV